ncbi:hypothetical protein [Flavobacterium sp. DSP2-3-1]|uniref:hypothetical protein n=1 Tax=Flavobacterium sp. DSP2-3-1 TaxID=2804620 RepID=UPI003CF0A4D5
MKYIQDENTETLIVTLIVFVIVCFFTIKWDMYETKKYEIEGEYRELLSKIRLRGAVMIFLIGIFSIVKELYKRF